mmetsp:Transcript_3723/g.9593  ORF Transcript_3723/g.9593 Transcript_3723/m.9593 type:complete len:514 (+) Transcript_3723:62-1603(+)|eukprot:CAMPEP_0117506748 /NCGR_PEP_ID=MMETSP0784-20121206/26069_1 /TAXON_ID=39447 /ORGANISM="" /LENGTH=513 /DNA_ID=CAMNT_0005302233 /DNA_START=60 /DNA_END=1601 /DNA_ORIENTATION=+
MATTPTDATVLKVSQRLPGQSAPEIRRYRIEEPFVYSQVDALIRENCGSDWVPKYKRCDDLVAMTASNFPDFIAHGHGGKDGVYQLFLDRVAETPSFAKWQVNAVRWVDYGESQSAAIDAAGTAGTRHVELSYDIAGTTWDYVVDLKELTQTNKRTGKVRSIRKFVYNVHNSTGAPREIEEKAQKISLKAEIAQLNTLWLPLLSRGSTKALVIECRSSGTALRVGYGGCVETSTIVDSSAVFVARAFGDVGGRQFVTFRSAAEGACLRPSESDPSVFECTGSADSEDSIFEVVITQYGYSASRRLISVGLSTYGAALRSVSTGRYVEVSNDGKVILADVVSEPDSDQPGELFVFRYQPGYDESWRDDGQYRGRRRWVFGTDPAFYTFEEFVFFVRERNFCFQPGGATGLEAAKLMWATSVPDGASEDEIGTAILLGNAMGEWRAWSASDQRQYTFTEMLAFVEARKLRRPGKTDLETVQAKWLEASVFAESSGEDVATELALDLQACCSVEAS